MTRKEAITGETLQDITGHESGAVVWDDGSVWVGNWSGCKGLPRALGPIDGIGLGEGLAAEPIGYMDIDAADEDAAKVAAVDGGHDDNPATDAAYRVNGECTVITFRDWA